jgi:hypothetical protein
VQRQAGDDGDLEQRQGDSCEIGLREYEQQAKDGQGQAEGKEDEAEAAGLQDAQGAHPTQLVTHEGFECGLVVFGLQHVGGQHDAQSEVAYPLPELIIVGEVVGNDLQTPDGLEGVAAHTQGLARHIVLMSEQPCEQHRGHVPLVDVHRAQA